MKTIVKGSLMARSCEVDGRSWPRHALAEMSKKPRLPPSPPGARQRTIVFALFDGFQILDGAGPIAAFEIATRFAPGAYRLVFAASAGGLVASSSGAAMPTVALKGMSFARVDTFIVVGGIGTRAAAADAALIGAVRRAAQSARRMASVCSGAFVLGAAGLIDDKRVTTHWRQAPLLQKLAPGARVEADRIFVKDGAVWTSAGVSAGIDLALAMIGEDLGGAVAKSVAREMVVYAQRPGGQSQHSAMLELGAAGGRFAALHDWMRAHLAEDLRVERLAQQAAMSARNFARAYAGETGVTPAKAVEKLRAEAARALIEDGAASVQDAARRCGFGDPERMRRAFLRLYGAPPAALKRASRAA
jgi:transcriptional regulator GlxA family with amidase domain